MKTCIFQTEAKLFRYFRPASEEAILHIWHDVKWAYSTLSESCGLHKRTVRNIRRQNVKCQNLYPKIILL